MMEYTGKNIGCWLIYLLFEMRAIGLYRHTVILGIFVLLDIK